MKFTRVGASLAMTAIAALSLTACAQNEAPKSGGQGGSTAAAPQQEQVSGSLKGSGSSAQSEAQTEWIAGFTEIQKDAKVEYKKSSSGDGRTAFKDGTSDFAGSDAAFKKDDLQKETFKACKSNSLVEVPAYISPIVVAYKLNGVNDLKLDAKTIASIFAGKITTWNDPAIAALNPEAKLPSTEIKTVHRSDKSGTTENFTDYLAQNASDVWTEKASGDWPAAFSGEAAAKSDGMKNALGNEGTIGYIDESFAGSLQAAQIKVGDAYVKPSAEGAAKALESSKIEDGREATDLAYKIDRKVTTAGAYPLLLVSYVIGCSEYKDAAVGKVAKAYFEYVVSEAGQQKSVAKAKNAPLSAELRKKVTDAISKIK